MGGEPATAAATPSPSAVAGSPCFAGGIATPPVACSSNTSTTTTVSGDVAATGAQAQTSLANSQTAAVLTGGGQGAASAQNSNSSKVTDVGIASGQSGLSAAERAPLPSVTAGPTAGVNVSQTLAVSGDTAAVGLTAQNSVVNNAQAAVIVGGASEAPITVQSSNSVVIQDVGLAAATSGSALARGGAGNLPAGAAGPAAPTVSPTVSPTATPAVSRTPRSTDTAPPTPALALATSHPAFTTGLSVANVIEGSSNSASLLAEGTPLAGATPLRITQVQNVALTAGGQASASSAGACAGDGCGSASPPSGTPPSDQAPTIHNERTVQASTGRAEAQGLAAQNSVNTNTNAGVRISGDNYGAVSVIIDTVTRIFNVGRADSQSGTAAANGSPETPSRQPTLTTAGTPGNVPGTPSTAAREFGATSGSAAATGAEVNNRVQLRSSASTWVDGDNYNPIDLFLRLAVSLANWGAGGASSGSAQSTGQVDPPNQAATSLRENVSSFNRSAVSASTGSARATGLDVQNQVDLWANVAVDIEGSNYAQIRLYVVLETDISNEGQARATSGNAQAGGAARRAEIGVASPAASPSVSGDASSGSAGAMPTPTAGTARSAGSPSSTPSGTSSTLGKTTILPSSNGQSSESTTGSLSSATTSSAENGRSTTSPAGGVTITHVVSGSADVVGLESSILAANRQSAVIAGPEGPKRTTANVSSIVVETRGQASASTGGTLTGPTPTATPRRSDLASTMSSPSGLDGASAMQGSRTSDETDEWSDRDATGGGGQRSRAGQPTRRVPGSVVKVNPWATWPRRDYPPMPGQKLRQPVAAKPPLSSATSITSAMPGQKPQGTLSEIDPWADWPEEALPAMPDGAPRAAQRPATAPEAPAAARQPAGVPTRPLVATRAAPMAPPLLQPTAPQPAAPMAHIAEDEEAVAGDQPLVAPASTEDRGVPGESGSLSPAGTQPPSGGSTAPTSPLVGAVPALLALSTAAAAWHHRSWLGSIARQGLGRVRWVLSVAWIIAVWHELWRK